MSHRVNLTLDDRTYERLGAVATARGQKPGTAAAGLVTAAIVDLENQSSAHIDREIGSREDVRSTPARRADWLELGRGASWRASVWSGVECLRRDYPDLAAALPTDWVADRFTRDGIVALAVWRATLDAGATVDPRTEHEWLRAQRSFVGMMKRGQPS